MATINYTYTDDRPNIVYQITCNCTRNSNSQITYSGTVTWNLRYSNSYIGPGYILECRATSSTGGDSGWIAFTEYENEYYGTTKRSFNYSFTATSSSAGAFDRVTFSFRNNSNYDSGYNSFSTYTDFSTPALLWTNCTAPSRVSSTSSSVITPGTLSVNWTEGTSGVDNAIKNYTVYWLVSSTSGQLPTTSWYSGKEVISGLSYSIPIPENYRGQYISVKVQSNATYNSPISNDYISRSVNSLPNSPSVSFTSKTIPSTQTSVTITDISPGSLNFGSKTGSVYWARTSDGNKDKVLEGKITDNTLGDLKQGDSRDYYFWTHDGLEYSSSYTTVTITKNIKPAITVELTSSTNSIVTGASNVLERVSFTVTAQNKACYYTVKILRGIGADEKTLYTLKSDSYLSGSGNSDTPSFNIRSLGLSEGDFYFHFACNDYIESGDSIIKDNGGKKYYSPALPTFSNDTTYNQFLEKNVLGANSTDFYQRLRFVSSHYDSYLYDNGIFRLDTGSNETISYTVAKKKDSGTSPTKIFYDVTITSDLIPGQTYDFFPTLQLAGLTSSALVSRRRTPVLDPTPSSGSTLYIKPFTDGYNGNNLSQKISISKGNFAGATLNDNFYNYYNIDKENSKWWESEILISGNQKIDISTLVKGGNISGDYYERNFTITDSTFFNKIPSNVSKTGVLTCVLKNTVTNRFGQTISKQSSIVTLDFNENPEIISLIREGNNDLYLYEGYKLRLTYTIKTFSYNNVIRYSCLINRKDGKGFVSYGNEGNIQDDNPSPKFGIGRIFTNTIEVTIGEIQQSGECYFNMIFYDGDSTIYNTNKAIPCQRIRFVNPTISFEKATYKKEGTSSYSVNCQYFISDYGYDLKQLDDKIFSINKEILTLNLSTESITPSTGDAVFHLDNEIVDFEIGRLTLTTTIIYNGQFITKISTSNDIIIYGITPTVAYRQNHLGINTSTLQDDSILTIAPTSGRNIIYLQKVGSADTTFKINLATGTLEGFIFNIDCGEIK